MVAVLLFQAEEEVRVIFTHKTIKFTLSLVPRVGGGGKCIFSFEGGKWLNVILKRLPNWCLLKERLSIDNVSAANRGLNPTFQSTVAASSSEPYKTELNCDYKCEDLYLWTRT